MATIENFVLNFVHNDPTSSAYEEGQGVEHNNVHFHALPQVERGVPSIPNLNVEPDEELEHQENDEVEGDGIEHRRVLSIGEKQMIYQALLARSVNGKLKRNSTNEVSSLFSVHLRAVQRIWKQAKATPLGTIVDFSDKRPKTAGPKRVAIDLSRLSDIPLNRRSTIRSIAEVLHVSKDILHRRFKEGLLRRHSNVISPYLKDENKIARLKFCISMLDNTSLPHAQRFIDMYNVVHIYEKLFYMSKKSKTFYLLPEEVDPYRSCQSKNFIGKVMFIVAIARPRFDDEGNEIFSGKIGVFPFVTKQPAQRRSRNREAGTLETKPITSVTKEIIRAFFLEKIIPAIQVKWPREDLGKTIFIQQDNARTHVRPNDEEFQIVASQTGLDIRLFCQPANSSDLNVLDLGFFRAIQSLQDKECTRNVDELICAVEKSFEEYPTTKINHVFLTLQSCMKEIMLGKESNRYKIPHTYKAGLERNGCLPRQISCDRVLVQSVINLLADHGGVS